MRLQQLSFFELCSLLVHVSAHLLIFELGQGDVICILSHANDAFVSSQSALNGSRALKSTNFEVSRVCLGCSEGREIQIRFIQAR